MTVSVGKSVGEASATAVNDTTKWVREQSESFGTELGTTHTMLPDQTVSDIAEEHNVKVSDIIKERHILFCLLCLFHAPYLVA